MVPYLQTVDGVLPQDVAARAGNRERAQVCISDPHGKGSILLPQTLSALDDGAEEVADVASHGKLRQADEQRHQGDGDQEHNGSSAVDDVLNGATCDDGQRDSPHVERQVLNGHQALLHARQVMLHKIGADKDISF